MTGVQTCALRSEEHTSELQSHDKLVCRLLLEKTTDRTPSWPPHHPRAPPTQRLPVPRRTDPGHPRARPSSRAGGGGRLMRLPALVFVMGGGRGSSPFFPAPGLSE